MTGDFAARLRDLRERNGWTVTDMAYRTGIPKRTLDKYMLRDGASLPGFDALVALSRGLGVSLDWLVFGSETVGETAELVARRCAQAAALDAFESLLREHREGKRLIFDSETILTLTPEEWAADLGVRAGERARELTAQGVTKEDLLRWSEAQKERAAELFRDMVERFTRSQDTGVKPD